MSDAGARAFRRARLKKEQKKAVDGLLAAALDAYNGQRCTEAQFICGEVLTFLPDSFDALKLLGACQLDTGQVVEAEAVLRRAVAIGPRSAEVLCNHGVALFRLGRFGEAREVFEAALALNPKHLVALKNLAMSLRRLNQHERAVECYDRALALVPRDADTWYHCGAAHFALGRISEAERRFTEALRLQPRFVEALIGQALVLILLSRRSAARDLLDQAVAIQPLSYEALAHRSGVQLALGDIEAARRDGDAALALAPPDFLPIALMARADVALALNDSALAAALAEQVLRSNPNSARALSVLGACRAATGETAEAVKLFDRALEIAPEDQVTISQKIFALDFLSDAGFADHQAARRQWWERIGVRFPRRQLVDIDADPARRLRIGYVSADLRNHSAAFTMRPVLRCHDRTQFEVFAYNTSTKTDEVTEEFRGFVDGWIDAAQMTDDELADRIMADRIDILVDASGHTAGHRLPVFVRKPAPVQVSAWGHGSGTGIPLIDYVFNDKVAIPEDVRPLHAEKIADLPCMITMESPGLGGSPLPMLRNGHVTFGVFNRIDKISDAAVALWSRIFAGIPDARLVVKHLALDDDNVRNKLMSRFVAHGIAAERVTWLGTSSREQHLRAFDDVDISLDPFPQNGGISTWESLYMGVPVVAKLGNALASRVAASILTAVGLADFVAADEDAYVAIARRFAAAPEALVALRAGLPERIAGSEAGDPVRYTGAVEACYRRFWRDYCATRTSAAQAVSSGSCQVRADNGGRMAS